MKEALAVKNGPEAPTAGIIGHSHMDTAWLWTVPETEKKCARTYSNQLSLMEQYPEYKFIQSSSCHSDMIRRNYPELLVFLTGGDEFSFDTKLKSIIFADRFLVLKGLNRILSYNDKL